MTWVVPATTIGVDHFMRKGSAVATEFPSAHVAPLRRSQSGSAWLHAKALWAFVATSASSLTKFPVVVLLLPFVLPATIVVARRGFAGAPAKSEGS
jgi:hypothetical protein